MQAKQLCDLPSEVLEYLCQHLERPSLQHFSVLSRCCYLAAKASLYRTIHLNRPLEDVAQWSQILARSSSLEHVRHLYIGAEPCQLDDTEDVWPLANTMSADDASWLPLANLIQNLSGLVQLTWIHGTTLPPCILAMLHAKRPPCRLHYRTFTLPGLLCPPNHLHLAPYELDVATSPSLHSVNLNYAEFYSNNQCVNYNQDALLDMVAGAAPNLREVYFKDVLYGFHSTLPSVLRTREWRSWRENPLSSSVPVSFCGALTCIVLDIRGEAGADMLKALHNRSDFRKLKILKLGYLVSTEAIWWMRDNCEFSSLHTLAIEPYERDSFEELEIATESFLQSLPPLSSLSITAYYSRHTLYSAFFRHGHTLKQLLLGRSRVPGGIWLDDRSILDDIRTHCPSLEELAFPLQRSLGDAEEVKFYRSLGAFRSLRQIHLSLDCSREWPAYCLFAAGSSPGPSRRYPQIWYNSEQSRQIREFLINAAMDKKLARTIFKVIATSKSASSLPLDQLSLGYRNPFPPVSARLAPVIQGLFSRIARSWKCTRNPRDDVPDHECFVEDCTKPQDWMPTWPREEDLSDAVKIAFRSIRPESPPPYRDFWTGWRSLPLDGVEMVE
ncbi:hypothetical protein K461DRAFT_323509 [Myriangium duriaei CBS 260.36]|uniref:F-box domain-containing protein n=1 Tax=Myriangium duriaei CBS 260.36 TaxID=1168546 RepID=A0A9P4IY74_9PEZI|nr:hypothetical protein K461DRAFT_323509 [Myriangium duriaei CBS 260.36]